MYKNLNAERARRNISLEQICSDPRIDSTISTMCKKLNGTAPLRFDEAIVIKDILNEKMPLEMTLEELFETEEE